MTVLTSIGLNDNYLQLMISEIASHITEGDIRSSAHTICERAQSPLFTKVNLISALRVAYIVFPSAEIASQFLNVRYPFS